MSCHSHSIVLLVRNARRSFIVKTITTFEDLEALLRGWMSFHDPLVYDLGGIVSLLGACLDNLEFHLVPGEQEDLRRYMSDDQVAFLRRLALDLDRVDDEET